MPRDFKHATQLIRQLGHCAGALAWTEYGWTGDVNHHGALLSLYSTTTSARSSIPRPYAGGSQQLKLVAGMHFSRRHSATHSFSMACHQRLQPSWVEKPWRHVPGRTT